MLTEFLGAIWKRLPGIVRRRVVRTGQRRFTVTAGAMIFDNEGRILLLDHVFRPDSGWGIPGGFLNKGEQPEAALRRELKEEIGIEVEAVELLFARTLPNLGKSKFTSGPQPSESPGRAALKSGVPVGFQSTICPPNFQKISVA